ncbi:hypothetical protein ACSBR1_015684 [Camellia fascicularis]
MHDMNERYLSRNIALNMVRRYPELAMSKLDDGKYALQAMAYSASAFSSGSRLNRWQHLIYSYVPVKLENYGDQDHNRSDIENPVNSSQVIIQKCSWAQILGPNFSNSVSQNLQAMLWKVLELLVPHIKHVQKQKLMHLQAIQLVKCLCEKIRSSSDSNAYESLCKDVILTAARLGIHEVVEEIIESFPRAVWSMDADNHNIFQLAVIYRCENVFNLIYQMSGYKQTVMMLMDDSMNSILHLVGRLAPHDKLNLVPGAALQMQRELQWFKEVEKFVRTSYKEMPNASGEIPSMIFTREHKNLVIEGEKWMKDTANSCTITAALIATIAFAAAITVPGGDNGTSGIPIFSNNKAFTIFATSDAISLFTSTASLLMFLSILTSRYAEDLISSTFGPGIFGKQSDRPFY